MGLIPAGLARRWEVERPVVALLSRELTPPQAFVGSFLLLILLGTIGLKIIPGLYVGPPLGWLDALFTATSAVCVTGLIVVDTATYFTPAGQAFVLGLIQLGGLGMITLTTLIIITLGRRISIRREILSAEQNVAAPVDVRRLTRDIVTFAVVIEGGGAVILWLLWAPRLGWLDAIWPAIFHSVSAFCNAGFSTFSDSLTGFAGAPLTLLAVGALIVAGGIGFLPMEEIKLHWLGAGRGKPWRPSLHTRIALAATGLLIGAGWILFTVFEWNRTLSAMPLVDRVANGLFLSITARTAGFNAVDYSLASDSSNFLTVLLMTVGGSPGSTAGGLKTTTFALVGLFALARLRGLDTVSIWERSVPPEIVQRAISLCVVYFGVITAAIFLFTVTERGDDFLVHMFEAASAFNTVGLSMGLTPDLSPAGKVAAIILMYLGRVGPLTFTAAVALHSRAPRTRYRFAHEDVIIG